MLCGWATWWVLQCRISLILRWTGRREQTTSECRAGYLLRRGYFPMTFVYVHILRPPNMQRSHLICRGINMTGQRNWNYWKPYYFWFKCAGNTCLVVMWSVVEQPFLSTATPGPTWSNHAVLSWLKRHSLLWILTHVLKVKSLVYSNFSIYNTWHSWCSSPAVSLSSPSGLYGGEWMWGSKSRDHHVPLQIHQWRLSKELRLQRRSTGQPAGRGHPVRSQEGERIREEHPQPQTLQVCTYIFCCYHTWCFCSHTQSKDLNLIIRDTRA